MEEAAGRLIAKAMGNGGEDNITVIIIAFDPDKNV
jgi:serine/threonine protein phosphatase PrpC